MPSRKKRKRYRRQSAEATEIPPGSKGGWGNGLPSSRRDFQLLRRAIQENWPISAQVRQEITLEIGGNYNGWERLSPRMSLRVADAITAMIEANRTDASHRIGCPGIRQSD